MAVLGKLFFVIQESLQLLGEMTHLAVVVLRQGLQKFLLVLLDVLVNGFHVQITPGNNSVVAKPHRLDQSVFVPLSPKAHKVSFP